MAPSGTRSPAPPRGDPLTAAQQRRALGPRRALRQGVGGDRATACSRAAPTQGAGQLPAGAVRGRLCRPGGRQPHGCRELARRSQRSWPRWACACRRPRRGSSTSTRALSSWGSVSSGIPGEARRDATSTPTRPRLPWRPSRRRCGRRLDKARTARCPAAPAQPGAAGMGQLLLAWVSKATFDYRAPSSGAGSFPDFAASTLGCPGSSYADATCLHGGRHRARRCSSIRRGCPSSSTAGGATASPRRGPGASGHEGQLRSPAASARGEPVARQRARRREPGKRTGPKGDTAPRLDPTT
jgi:hypothetical protein